jgi:hypothetical protein
MKKTILSILAATASWVSASTVSLSSGGATTPSPTVYNHANSAVVTSGLVRVGMMSNPADMSTFVEFGTSAITFAGIGTNRREGKINGPVANNNLETDDAQFNGKDIYIWVYNAATAAAATEQGLFKVVEAVGGPDQQFPVDDPGGFADSTTVDGRNITQYIALNIPGFDQGKVDPTTDSSGATRLVLGAIVPEPSSMGLLALAGLALSRRRR